MHRDYRKIWKAGLVMEDFYYREPQTCTITIKHDAQLHAQHSPPRQELTSAM